MWHHCYNRMCTHVGKTNQKLSIKWKYSRPLYKKLTDLNHVRKKEFIMFLLVSLGSVDASESFSRLFLSLPHCHFPVYIPYIQDRMIILFYYISLHYVKFMIQDKLLVSGIEMVYFNLRVIPSWAVNFRSTYCYPDEQPPLYT